MMFGRVPGVHHNQKRQMPATSLCFELPTQRSITEQPLWLFDVCMLHILITVRNFHRALAFLDHRNPFEGIKVNLNQFALAVQACVAFG